MRLAALLPSLFVLASCASWPASAEPSEQDVIASVDARYEETAAMADQLWHWAEVGYQETKSSQLMMDALAGEGFTVDSGIAGIPTAFLAEWGTGGPVIAILAEMDALPGVNQAAAPTRERVRGKLAGHACGHNLFGAGSVTAAIAVKDWLEETGAPGTIRLYGTPAEEGGSGKVYMVREGLFDDVDFSIHWHADDENSASADSSLANRSAKFRFTGAAAHAAAAPERGRSALDGVEAFNMMVNMLREHVPQDARIHYVITEGGTAPNIVPEFAEVFYYVRHPSPSGVEEIWARVEDAARGAALGTGTEVEWEVIHGNNPLLVNEALGRVMDEKLRLVGGVNYSESETEFAEEMRASFAIPDLSLESAAEIQPFGVGFGYGSTDVGDVSIATPTVGVRTATWVPGTAAHTWQAVAASGMSIGHKGTQVAAKAMALTAIEIYTNPQLRRDARKEFEQARGEDYTYTSLLGDRDPPLDYRR